MNLNCLPLSMTVSCAYNNYSGPPLLIHSNPHWKKPPHDLSAGGGGDGPSTSRQIAGVARLDLSLSRPQGRRNVAGVIGPAADDSAEQLLGGSLKRGSKQRKTVSGVDQDDLVDPAQLADPDSCFHVFHDVHIHHKIYDVNVEEGELNVSANINSRLQHEASQLWTRRLNLGLPIILLHGFGASVFSWSKLMKPLAHLVGSKVLAFDRPAFGLTSRVEYTHSSGKMNNGKTALRLNPYSMAFSVMATLSCIDLLSADKAILMGHSAGCLVAVDTYFKDPDRVVALILVAPAIMAPVLPQTSRRKSDPEEGSTGSVDEELIYDELRIFRWCQNCVIGFFSMIQRAVIWALRGILAIIRFFYTRILCAVLRSYLGILFVRVIMSNFGVAAVKNAWYDASQVTEHVINGYTKPLKVKGWDRALLEFTIAALVENKRDNQQSVDKMLCKIACPVLIITGDSDRIVPAWNAKRLSAAIPSSCFEVIEKCGHLPHEEKPEEFLSVVETFLARFFTPNQHKYPNAAA